MIWGLIKEENSKNSFEPGINIIGKVTVFAEGCRGHLGKEVIRKYSLDQNKSPQQYGIGFKEIWEVSNDQYDEGLVLCIQLVGL